MTTGSVYHSVRLTHSDVESQGWDQKEFHGYCNWERIELENGIAWLRIPHGSYVAQ